MSNMENKNRRHLFGVAQYVSHLSNLTFVIKTKHDADEIENSIAVFLNDHLNLNCCNRCGSWQDSAHEMYWQGDEDAEVSEVLGDYVAVCDDCFHELYNDYTNKVIEEMQ